jgi:hypothetical protein
VGHDQRFKEFLYVFLQDFLKLFYPAVEKRLDFRSVEFLDKKSSRKQPTEAAARPTWSPSSVGKEALPRSS